MLTESNRIIMVDDHEEDLLKLSNVFYNKGIGCKKFIYDSFYSNPLKGVRMLFLDINLNNAQSEQQRNSTLQDAITHYIHEDNGPYILVLWTSNTEWIASFKTFVTRDNNENFIKHSPFYITNIDKTEFYNEQNSFDDKICSIFGESAVKLIFEYENIMSNVVDSTITKLIDLIPRGNVWENNDTFDNNCQQVLSAIAVHTMGYALAKQNPDYAIKEALIPLLSDAFRNFEHTLWNTNIDILENSTTSDDICFPDNFKVSQLNNIFNIQSKGNITAETRGALCPIILEPNEDFFIDKFGYSVLEFCNLIIPKIIQEDLENIQLICVEYSAACDFCQNKERTCKYLLGMAISPDLFNTKTKRGRSKLKESILRIRGIYDIQDQEKIILFNLNFSFTLPKSIMRNLIGNPLFCFQKEMMDMIGHAYASHHSRIGITTFEK